MCGLCVLLLGIYTMLEWCQVWAHVGVLCVVGLVRVVGGGVALALGLEDLVVGVLSQLHLVCLGVEVVLVTLLCGWGLGPLLLVLWN